MSFGNQTCQLCNKTVLADASATYQSCCQSVLHTGCQEAYQAFLQGAGKTAMSCPSCKTVSRMPTPIAEVDSSMHNNGFPQPGFPPDSYNNYNNRNTNYSNTNYSNTILPPEQVEEEEAEQQGGGLMSWLWGGTPQTNSKKKIAPVQAPPRQQPPPPPVSWNDFESVLQQELATTPKTEAPSYNHMNAVWGEKSVDRPLSFDDDEHTLSSSLPFPSLLDSQFPSPLRPVAISSDPSSSSSSLSFFPSSEASTDNLPLPPLSSQFPSSTSNASSSNGSSVGDDDAVEIDNNNASILVEDVASSSSSSPPFHPVSSAHGHGRTSASAQPPSFFDAANRKGSFSASRLTLESSNHSPFEESKYQQLERKEEEEQELETSAAQPVSSQLLSSAVAATNVSPFPSSISTTNVEDAAAAGSPAVMLPPPLFRPATDPHSSGAPFSRNNTLPNNTSPATSPRPLTSNKNPTSSLMGGDSLVNSNGLPPLSKQKTNFVNTSLAGGGAGLAQVEGGKNSSTATATTATAAGNLPPLNRGRTTANAFDPEQQKETGRSQEEKEGKEGKQGAGEKGEKKEPPLLRAASDPAITAASSASFLSEIKELRSSLDYSFSNNTSLPSTSNTTATTSTTSSTASVPSSSVSHGGEKKEEEKFNNNNRGLPGLSKQQTVVNFQAQQQQQQVNHPPLPPPPLSIKNMTGLPPLSKQLTTRNLKDADKSSTSTLLPSSTITTTTEKASRFSPAAAPPVPAIYPPPLPPPTTTTIPTTTTNGTTLPTLPLPPPPANTAISSNAVAAAVLASSADWQHKLSTLSLQLLTEQTTHAREKAAFLAKEKLLVAEAALERDKLKEVHAQQARIAAQAPAGKQARAVVLTDEDSIEHLQTDLALLKDIIREQDAAKAALQQQVYGLQSVKAELLTEREEKENLSLLLAKERVLHDQERSVHAQALLQKETETSQVEGVLLEWKIKHKQLMAHSQQLESKLMATEEKAKAVEQARVAMLAEQEAWKLKLAEGQKALVEDEKKRQAREVEFAARMQALEQSTAAEVAKVKADLEKQFVESLEAKMTELQQHFEQEEAQLRYAMEEERKRFSITPEDLAACTDAATVEATAVATKKFQADQEKRDEEWHLLEAEYMKKAAMDFDQRMLELETKNAQVVEEVEAQKSKEIEDILNEAEKQMEEQAASFNKEVASIQQAIAEERAQWAASVEKNNVNIAAWQQQVEVEMHAKIEEEEKKSARFKRDCISAVDQMGAFEDECIALRKQLEFLRAQNEETAQTTTTQQQQWQKRVEQLEKTLAETEQQHEKALAELEQDLTSTLQQQHEAAMQQLVAEHAASLRKSLDECEKQAVNEIEKKMAGVEAQSIQWENTEKELRLQLEEWKHGAQKNEAHAKELDELRLIAQQAMHEVNEEHVQVAQEKKALEELCAQHVREKEELQQQLEKLAEDARQAFAAQQQQVDEWKKQLEEEVKGREEALVTSLTNEWQSKAAAWEEEKKSQGEQLLLQEQLQAQLDAALLSKQAQEETMLAMQQERVQLQEQFVADKAAALQASDAQFSLRLKAERERMLKERENEREEERDAFHTSKEKFASEFSREADRRLQEELDILKETLQSEHQQETSDLQQVIAQTKQLAAQAAEEHKKRHLQISSSIALARQQLQAFQDQDVAQTQEVMKWRQQYEESVAETSRLQQALADEQTTLQQREQEQKLSAEQEAAKLEANEIAFQERLQVELEMARNTWHELQAIALEEKETALREESQSRLQEEVRNALSVAKAVDRLAAEIELSEMKEQCDAELTRLQHDLNGEREMMEQEKAKWAEQQVAMNLWASELQSDLDQKNMIVEGLQEQIQDQAAAAVSQKEQSEKKEMEEKEKEKKDTNAALKRQQQEEVAALKDEYEQKRLLETASFAKEREMMNAALVQEQEALVAETATRSQLEQQVTVLEQQLDLLQHVANEARKEKKTSVLTVDLNQSRKGDELYDVEDENGGSQTEQTNSLPSFFSSRPDIVQEGAVASSTTAKPTSASAAAAPHNLSLEAAMSRCAKMEAKLVKKTTENADIRAKLVKVVDTCKLLSVKFNKKQQKAQTQFLTRKKTYQQHILQLRSQVTSLRTRLASTLTLNDTLRGTDLNTTTLNHSTVDLDLVPDHDLTMDGGDGVQQGETNEEGLSPEQYINNNNNDGEFALHNGDDRFDSNNDSQNHIARPFPSRSTASSISLTAHQRSKVGGTVSTPVPQQRSKKRFAGLPAGQRVSGGIIATTTTSSISSSSVVTTLFDEKQQGDEDLDEEQLSHLMEEQEEEDIWASDNGLSAAEGARRGSANGTNGVPLASSAALLTEATGMLLGLHPPDNEEGGEKESNSTSPSTSTTASITTTITNTSIFSSSSSSKEELAVQITRLTAEREKLQQEVDQLRLQMAATASTQSPSQVSPSFRTSSEKDLAGGEVFTSPSPESVAASEKAWNARLATALSEASKKYEEEKQTLLRDSREVSCKAEATLADLQARHAALQKAQQEVQESRVKSEDLYAQEMSTLKENQERVLRQQKEQHDFVLTSLHHELHQYQSELEGLQKEFGVGKFATDDDSSVNGGMGGGSDAVKVKRLTKELQRAVTARKKDQTTLVELQEMVKKFEAEEAIRKQMVQIGYGGKVGDAALKEQREGSLHDPNTFSHSVSADGAPLTSPQGFSADGQTAPHTPTSSSSPTDAFAKKSSALSRSISTPAMESSTKQGLELSTSKSASKKKKNDDTSVSAGKWWQKILPGGKKSPEPKENAFVYDPVTGKYIIEGAEDDESNTGVAPPPPPRPPTTPTAQVPAADEDPLMRPPPSVSSRLKTPSHTPKVMTPNVFTPRVFTPASPAPATPTTGQGPADSVDKGPSSSAVASVASAFPTPDSGALHTPLRVKLPLHPGSSAISAHHQQQAHSSSLTTTSLNPNVHGRSKSMAPAPPSTATATEANSGDSNGNAEVPVAGVNGGGHGGGDPHSNCRQEIACLQQQLQELMAAKATAGATPAPAAASPVDQQFQQQYQQLQQQHQQQQQQQEELMGKLGQSEQRLMSSNSEINRLQSELQRQQQQTAASLSSANAAAISSVATSSAVVPSSGEDGGKGGRISTHARSLPRGSVAAYCAITPAFFVTCLLGMFALSVALRLEQSEGGLVVPEMLTQLFPSLSPSSSSSSASAFAMGDANKLD